MAVVEIQGALPAQTAAGAVSPPGQALQAGDIVQVLLHQNGTGVAITAGAFVLVELA
jgi:hypothetical protein